MVRVRAGRGNRLERKGQMRQKKLGFPCRLLGFRRQG